MTDRRCEHCEGRGWFPRGYESIGCSACYGTGRIPTIIRDASLLRSTIEANADYDPDGLTRFLEGKHDEAEAAK